MKKLIIFIFILIFASSLASCYIQESPGNNGEYTPDNDAEPPVQDDTSVGETTDEDESKTEENVPNIDEILPITANGEVYVKIVASYFTPKALRDEIKVFYNMFSDLGMVFETSTQTDNNKDTYEILIGDDIGADEKYYVDPIYIGDTGYVIKIVDNKLIIAGGSDDKLLDAFKIFVNDILMLGDESADLKNIGVKRDTLLENIKEYPLKSVTVCGSDLSEYSIVCDKGDELMSLLATRLRKSIYDNSGYWLKILRESEDPAVRIRISDDSGDTGFRMYVLDGDIIIECFSEYLISECIDKLIEEHFTSSEDRDMEFNENYLYTIGVNTIGYCSYGGAVGDGVSDDFEAIKRTHERANITGQTVVAESGKKFNMGKHADTIIIKTDVVWTGAEFIIDDSDILPDDPARLKNIFEIASDTKEYSISGITTLKKGQQNIGVTFDSDVMLHIVNSNVKHYIRYGLNSDNGYDQQELILVDKDGNVDPKTPIVWDYDTVTSVTVYDVSNKTITILGGTFTTIANQAPREYTYYYRGIGIKRSNVTIKDMVHYVIGEGENGAPYAGFHSVNYVANILFDNVTYTAHKTYKLESDSNNNMGTYDFQATNAVNITWKNCTQTNSITDTSYWGVMGGNTCKNFTYDGCKFSRLDSHRGTYNISILNSEIGHQHASVIGGGTLLIENSIMHGENIIDLRGDYGSTWDGDVIIRNVTLNNTSQNPVLIKASWYQHDFGYVCHLPKTVTIDGLTLATGTSAYVFPNNLLAIAATNSVNPVCVTESVVIKSNPNGYNIGIQRISTGLFENTLLYYSDDTDVAVLPVKEENE